MKKPINNLIKNVLGRFSIEFNSKQLKPLPNSIIFASLMLSISAITQFFTDIILESLSFFDLIPKIPFRIDFVSLTALSALLAYHTLFALRRRDLELTQDAIQVSFVVEAALVAGDFWFLYQTGLNKFSSFIRLPFIILTLINILLLIYITLRMNIYEYKRFQRKKREQLLN